MSRRFRLAIPLLGVALLAACSDGSPTDGGRPAVAYVVGKAVPLEGTLAGGWSVTATWPTAEGTAPLAADGSFEVPLEAVPAGAGTLRVHPPPGGDDYHPAWLRLSAQEAASDVRVILLPTTWTVREGAHAGTAVPISPAEAADPTVLPSYWGFVFPFDQQGTEQTVLDPTHWTAGFRSWERTAFPVAVALDRDGSTDPPTAADSVLLWGHLAELERVLGRDLFRPAAPGEVDLDGQVVSGGVVVATDASLEFRGFTDLTLASDWFLGTDTDAGSWSGGMVTSFAAVSADVEGGRVRLRSRALFEDRRLVLHEMMHVLGAGHGCRWPSIQTYCEDLETPLPTAEDVAYLEALEAARSLEDATRTRHGLLGAVFGERVLTRGLDPIPTAPGGS